MQSWGQASIHIIISRKYQALESRTIEENPVFGLEEHREKMDNARTKLVRRYQSVPDPVRR